MSFKKNLSRNGLQNLDVTAIQFLDIHLARLLIVGKVRNETLNLISFLITIFNNNTIILHTHEYTYHHYIFEYSITNTIVSIHTMFDFVTARQLMFTIIPGGGGGGGGHCAKSALLNI